MRVLNIGSLNIDYVYRVSRFIRAHETMPVMSRSVHCGGKGLNQSIAAAKAGLSVYHAGMIGPEGGILRDMLAENGVDTSFVRSGEEPGGHTVIQVTDDGENCILLYGGTNRMLTTEFVDETLAGFSPGDALILQNEVNLMPYILRRAADKGMRVAFNAAPMDASVLSYPLETVAWLVVNEVEGAALAGCEAPEAILDALCARYPDTAIVLTLGADGAMLRDSYGTIAVPAYPVTPVDTTGAGDTFLGYFLSGALNGATSAEAMRFASAASAITILRPGAADSIPRRREVLAAVERGALTQTGE